jgi:hypothetical protein
MRIKAVTLWDPWGTLVSLEEKLYETRSWATSHRGPLAIHVAQRWPAGHIRVLQQAPFLSVLSKHGFVTRGDFSLGCVVAVVDLTAVYRTEDMRASLGEQELAFGNYSNGRYAWKLANVRRLPEPVPARGAQQLWWWDVPDRLVGELSLVLD